MNVHREFWDRHLSVLIFDLMPWVWPMVKDVVSVEKERKKQSVLKRKWNGAASVRDDQVNNISSLLCICKLDPLVTLALLGKLQLRCSL